MDPGLAVGQEAVAQFHHFGDVHAEPADAVGHGVGEALVAGAEADADGQHGPGGVGVGEAPGDGVEHDGPVDRSDGVGAVGQHLGVAEAGLVEDADGLRVAELAAGD